MTHTQLQELCEYPALIETQEQLDEIVTHIKGCDGCERLVRRSLAFDHEFFAPLRAVSDRHVRWWEMLGLKLARFHRGATPPRNRAGWHIQTCSVCSVKFDRFSLLAFARYHPLPALASIVLLCVIGGLIWSYFPRNDTDTFRAQLRPQLVDPGDGASINGWRELKWSAPGSLTQFTLTIRDVAGDKVVIHKQVDATFYSFNADDLKNFVSGKQYEWWVAVEINHKWIESEHRKFFYEEHQGQYTIPDDQRRKFEHIEHDGKKAERQSVLLSLRKQLAVNVNSPADIAWLHQTIGAILIQLEDEPGGTAELRQAVAAWEGIAAPDSWEYARALVNLGYAAEDIGALQEALVAYQKADTITRKGNRDAFRKLRGTCLLNLGTLERELGDYDSARTHYNEALGIDEQLYQEGKLSDRSHQADELHNLGNLYVDEYGDPDRGFEKLQQAHDIQEKVPSHTQQRSWADVLDSLAKAYAVKGELEKAVDLYSQAIALSHQQGDLDKEVESLNNLVEALIDGAKISLAHEYVKKADSIIGRAPPGKVSPDTSWTTQALLGKIYVAEKQYKEAESALQTSIQMVSHLKAVLPASGWYVFRGARQQPLFDLIMLLVEEGRSQAAFEQLQKFKLEPFGDSLRLEAVAAKLDDRTVGLDYVIGLPSDPVILFVKTATGLEAFRLDARSKIDVVIRSAAMKLQANGEAADELSTLPQLLLPETVRQGIVSGRFNHLVISPDGDIHNVPFAALVIEKGTGRKLVEYADVSIVPSLQWWFLARAQFPQRMQQSNDAVVASVDYSSCRGSGLLPLPWAAKEAGNVMGYASLRSRWINGLDLKSASLGDFKIVHFAGHAEATHSHETSRLALGCSSPADDLTGTEIRKLKLDHSLVVLDACESGAGKVVPGEGVESLAQSFLLAGAACVISTRTLVHDTSAIDMAQSFYSGLYGSRSISEALQKAQQQASKKVPTFEWSAFTAYGNCNIPVDINPNRWEKLKYSITGHF